MYVWKCRNESICIGVGTPIGKKRGTLHLAHSSPEKLHRYCRMNQSVSQQNRDNTISFFTLIMICVNDRVCKRQKLCHLHQQSRLIKSLQGFPDSSAGKETACNAGRSPGEGIGYPLQYSWASLVAQLVKNLPAMRETWVRSLGWKDPLEKRKATHSSILAWRIPWTL